MALKEMYFLQKVYKNTNTQMHVWTRFCTDNTTGFIVTSQTKKHIGKQDGLAAAFLLTTNVVSHRQTDAEGDPGVSLMERLHLI